MDAQGAKETWMPQGAKETILAELGLAAVVDAVRQDGDTPKCDEEASCAAKDGQSPQAGDTPMEVRVGSLAAPCLLTCLSHTL